MKRRHLGRSGPAVSAIGLGCMGMSGTYGPADRSESIATIRSALAGGIDLIDTGDFYGMGHNELLVAEALRAVPRDAYRLSVKFGALRDRRGGWLGYDLRPEAIANFLAYSLVRLGVDHIDIYRPARLDPAVPIEDVVGALSRLVEAGDILHIGLSEVGTETLRRAAAIHPISDLQIEYSLLTRDIEESILPAARELGIGVSAYGVLSRGLIGGWRKGPLAPGDIRHRMPRFHGAEAEANLRLVATLNEIARELGATVPQLAIAWVLAQGEDIVPLVGTRRRDHLSDALAALDLTLGPADLAAIEAAIPKGAAAGPRYAAAQLAMLDSESRPKRKGPG